MRRLISSLIVLATVVSANGLVAGQITTTSAGDLKLTGRPAMAELGSHSTIMRPAVTRSSQFSGSQRSTLLRRANEGLRQTRRPVARMPQVSTSAQVPVSSSRLLGSASSTIHRPQSSLFRSSAGSGKLLRRR